ncbi:MAG: 3-hydroxyacyl-ACP dehydratase [Flavobacteriales bacterium]|jgi:predicted hotdog family 3-hydroxylacyl-ACP dehydratase|nr:3-hydroxyacyl-ACP dehydratase [Flavobacteriales bacterium]MBK6754538.1 3-hydroxyacyl-ACP dehydratase [Flavobacteriales bacterium]MBK7083168.1 3-hydroxyacyl-ACP dehydratase [Flavobacteriales bacterium]MBK7271320.1 3-hydroxyacyl-ACP dehydratase [Flavobacteriales bacterium]MBK7752923.1 3-hydroxyacyl-ACP dehydratase [Flavobacteriales bacterium]
MTKPPLLQGDDILTYLPHRPPIVLVDQLMEAEADRTVTCLTVAANNPFVEDGLLLEGGLIEHVAQSSAVGSGYAGARSGERDPRVGFIGAVTRLRIERHPVLGEQLETEVITSLRMENVQVIHGTVRCHGDVLAEMEMKVFLMESAHAG